MRNITSKKKENKNKQTNKQTNRVSTKKGGWCAKLSGMGSMDECVGQNIFVAGQIFFAPFR